jgi:hypothetical protein
VPGGQPGGRFSFLMMVLLMAVLALVVVGSQCAAQLHLLSLG